ncbi:MAG TPA: cyclic nucleotide-binding and patatin-like phospholipase domain-containing protein [Solirubrobacteraceae bacterium]|nr:cyclic nucleotide-binding and patatin-like phospholipase domain-containing protein [Solirubrobacteraceae bacterium]
MRDVSLGTSPLFSGLTETELEVVAARMRPRRFAPGEQLCAAGDASDRIWLITGGLVIWSAGTTAGGGDIELRMRKGDVIGAQDVITQTERTATVSASTITDTLELDGSDLLELAERFPRILINVIHTQRERLFRASAQSAALFSATARSSSNRGEEIGVIAGRSLKGVVNQLVVAARLASPRPVTVADRSLSFAGALTASDELASQSDTVLIPSDLDPETLGVLLDEVDRVVALVGNGEEAAGLGRIAAAAEGRRLEVVLVSDEARQASQLWQPGTLELIVRDCPRQPGFPLADADLAWLARHLTRTKLGVALGAGGAKGYAHVGFLQVLQDAGYTVDYAGGSSIGGFVATQLALGYDARTIDARFRKAFNEDAVAKLFSSPLVGTAGMEMLTSLLRQATEERSFSQTAIPLAILAVDLTDRAPVAQRSGPLWQALLAALSVAGVFPTQERDGHRLIDAIALVPVPTAAVLEDGADIVASVNLLGTETLDAWPGVREEAEEEPKKPRRRGPLDTILEAMDLSQLDTSARHAALADVVITPRFGPAEWRDFHLADLFLEAGRKAALEQLPALQALARPIDLDTARRQASIA